MTAPYFDITAVSGRLYTLPMLKAAWRRRFPRSIQCATGWTRAEYNREGYRLLEDPAWMRGDSGSVPAAVLRDAEDELVRRFVGGRP